MLHLSDERLAALADDEPNAAEADHLAVCRRCAAERVSQRRLLAMATAAHDHISPPLVDWSVIADRLRNEGMLGSGGENSGRFQAAVRPAWMTEGRTATPAAITPVVPLRSRNAEIKRWGMRAAAAMVFVAGGAAIGRMSVTGPRLEAAAPVATASSGVRNVSIGAAAGVPAETYPIYGSVEEAMRAMEVAQMQYQYASTFIARNDTTTRAPDDRAYRTRLAALDEIAATSRAALYRAPHDPVLNQYYLSTLGAREATLQLLGNRLPGGSRLARY
jgi:hypothetical protein